MGPVMAIQNGPTRFIATPTEQASRRPRQASTDPAAPHICGRLCAALPITQEVSSGQGWRYQHQAVGHPKGSHRRSSPFFTHALPEPEAFPVHGQDVGLMGQPVQEGPGQPPGKRGAERKSRPYNYLIQLYFKKVTVELGL
jgi:hypothetical protein